MGRGRGLKRLRLRRTSATVVSLPRNDLRVGISSAPRLCVEGPRYCASADEVELVPPNTVLTYVRFRCSARGYARPPTDRHKGGSGNRRSARREVRRLADEVELVPPKTALESLRCLSAARRYARPSAHPQTSLAVAPMV